MLWTGGRDLSWVLAVGRRLVCLKRGPKHQRAVSRGFPTAPKRVASTELGGSHSHPLRFARLFRALVVCGFPWNLQTVTHFWQGI